MNPMFQRSAFALAMIMSSAPVWADTMHVVPACVISHNDNETVCQLSLRDGDFSSTAGWQTYAGEPEVLMTDEGSYIRLAQPAVGVSQLVHLPLGSTVDSRRMPTYRVDLRMRSTPMPAAMTEGEPATALVRLSLTDDHGENGIVIGETTVAASADGWQQSHVRADAVPYHFNAFLKVDVIRNDGEPQTALDLDDIAITQLTI